MQRKFHILMVCTGNICRSPLAEQLLIQRVSEFPGISVSSAGTHALENHPTPAHGQKIARDLGAEQVELHRGRSLSKEILAEADLILTMSREQRRLVTTLDPKALKRVFTLREFTRLAEKALDGELATEISRCAGVPHERLQAAIQAVTYARSLSPPPVNPIDEDIVDPYRRSLENYQHSARQILSAVEKLTIFLGCALVGMTTTPDPPVQASRVQTARWEPVVLILALSLMIRGLLQFAGQGAPGSADILRQTLFLSHQLHDPV